MPSRLRAAVEKDAGEATGASVVQLDAERARRGRSDAGASPWPWLATAAAVIVAIAGWWPLGPSQTSSALSLEAGYAALVAANALELDWTATEDPTATGASGAVLWDAATQTGFMRFSGLAANDPTQFQYQLWIFDAERGEQYPVDGGVFDIPAGDGEVIVPIKAHLPIDEATLFAVTVERPGGVVVSSRERIAVLAAVG